MARALTSLPQDVLILICIHLQVEHVLALMQTCRVMHVLGSLDYLWHRLLSDWDIPLDIHLNTALSSLSSDALRAAAVKSLKLDMRWRNPRLEMRCVQCVIPQNSSFIDGMCLLPGGRWLVTLQYEQTARTHVTLWSTGDVNDCRSIFKVTVSGRVRFLHAHHHHQLEQIMIGIAFARGSAESIWVYNISLQDDSSAMIFEATPHELHTMGRIAGMKINGEVMITVFASLTSLPESEGRIACVNLISRATTILECPDWSLVWGRLKTFRRYFAVTTSHYNLPHTITHVSFYELPSTILGHQDCLSSFAPRWPDGQVIKCSSIASATWRSDHPLVFELSDDAPTDDTDACSFTMLGRSIHTPHTDVKSLGIDLLRVSFDGNNVECIRTVMPCHSGPSPGEIRVSSSGRRAVWLSSDPETHACTLVKFALERGDGLGSSFSTLMPSFSGLPFNPRDFHTFVFDEVSCRIAVGLPSGELYMLHY